MYTCDLGKIDWILDSGSSDHIINNDSYFCESSILKKPLDVVVGDGRVWKGTKVGKVVTYFEVNGIKSKIEISIDVLFVENMGKNLLSFAKITSINQIISIKITAKI